MYDFSRLFSKFFVLEGTDGSGKKTQSQMIYLALKKHYEGIANVVLLDFPDYGNDSGKVIKNMLQGKYGDNDQLNPYSAASIMAFNRYEYFANLVDTLDYSKPIVAVANRYTTSNIIHQSVKFNGDIKEIAEFIRWCNDLEFFKLQLPKPTKTFFLHIPYKIAYNNLISSNKELDMNEKLEYLKEVERNYCLLVKHRLIGEYYNPMRIIECASGKQMIEMSVINAILLKHIKGML